MASTDARPVPRKNVAYRVMFPILDADGDLVTGAAGLDSEISKDQGAFADCTNEATEIATSSGVYYLDLTSTEMNADGVAIICKTSTSGAKTTVLTLYPEEAGDYRTDVVQWNGTTVASPATAGYPAVTIKAGTGTGEINLASGVITGMASQASVDTIDDFIDTEVLAIKAKTDLIPGTQDGKTFAETVLLMASALLGKASGLATTTAVYRSLDDAHDRITATVDADGNRSAVTLDASSP
jgi:hypothetical protein